MRTKIKSFGFEIEGEWSEDAQNKMNDYGSIKSDGSLSRCSSTKHNYLPDMEFASNILNTLSEARKIFSLVKEYHKKKEYHYNDTMGFHIHVSFSPKTRKPVEIFSTQFYKFFTEELKKTFPKVYKKRSENTYCPVRNLNDSDVLTSTQRYNAVNFLPAYRKFGTIEFRIFPASTPDKMKKYFLFTLKTIRKFLNSEIKINPDMDFQESSSFNPEAREIELTEAFIETNESTITGVAEEKEYTLN